jgi:hypothetical protein
MRYTLILLLFLSFNSFAQKRFLPDTTINRKILLLNSESIIKSIGDQKENKFEDEGLPRVYFINQMEGTYVILYGQPGSNANKFAYFEVGLVSNLNGKICGTYSKKFRKAKTESGVQLGITSQKVFSIKGRGYKREKIGNQIKYSYSLRKPQAINFLNRYNMPTYSAEYFFEKNKLVKFRFGFDYP